MQKPSNLRGKIESSLPTGLVTFIQKAAYIAGRKGEPLYLVGGAVRDLLLGEPSYDIDLTVEGDAIELAKELTESEFAKGGRIALFPQFGTAKLELPDGITIDIARARKEAYARPGALPTVSPGTLHDDLFRRDFTVNAMAIALDRAHYGVLIDLFGGLSDLEHKLIRILHDKSFVDDATRIWRAIRYAARFDFTVERHTLELLRRDMDYLDTISGDRIRYELECILNEDGPEKAIELAGELGVLPKLSPKLRESGLLAMRFRRARELSQPDKPPFALYLAILAYPLDSEEIGNFIKYLRLDKTTSRVLLDACEVRDKAIPLGDPDLTCSSIYHLLQEYNPLAIRTIYIESNDATVWQHIDFYLDVLQKIKPLLSGKDVQKLGVPEGPKIKEVLEILLDARLNGEVKTREDEEGVVEGWVEEML